MSHALKFPIQNFDYYCDELQRLGIEPGFVLYTNHHASNGLAETRFVSANQLDAVETYLASPSDQTFIPLVKMGVLLDNEWDRNTRHWALISFNGWEKLHHAFERLLNKADQGLINLSGLSSLEVTEIVSNGY